MTFLQPSLALVSRASLSFGSAVINSRSAHADLSRRVLLRRSGCPPTSPLLIWPGGRAPPSDWCRRNLPRYSSRLASSTAGGGRSLPPPLKDTREAAGTCAPHDGGGQGGVRA